MTHAAIAQRFAAILSDTALFNPAERAADPIKTDADMERVVADLWQRPENLFRRSAGYKAFVPTGSNSRAAHPLAHARTRPGIKPSPTPANNPAHSPVLFIPVARGSSFSTPVAVLVFNTHTQRPELWVTPQHYAKTTDRHCGPFRSAYAAAYRKVFGDGTTNYDTVARSIYAWEPTAVRHPRSRADALVCRPRTYESLLGACSNVTKPGLPAPTRVARARGVIRSIDEALRTATCDVPQDYWSVYATPAAATATTGTYPVDPLHHTQLQQLDALRYLLTTSIETDTVALPRLRAGLAGLGALLDTE